MFRMGSMVLGVLLLVLAGGSALAGDVVVSDAYARITPTGSGGAFLVIHNHAGEADRLVAVGTPVARKAELHITEMEEGVMRMRHVDAVDVPAGETTALKPGGPHIMLFGVPGGLKAGDTIDITLSFERAGDVTVSAEIRALGTSHDMDGHSH